MTNSGVLKFITKSVLLSALLAVVYFVLGLFGLLFKISGYSFSAVAPSAGLSLASILLFGKRILPGIFIGSFLVNAWVYSFAQNLFWLYVANAAGDCFAAWLASVLVYKVNVFPDPLDTISKIVKFMTLSGPVSSLVPVAIRVYFLCSYEIIPRESILFAFSISWLGCILGVVVFMPLLLMVLGAPQPIWHRRIKTVGLPVILSFTLVAVIFFYLNAVSRRVSTERLIEHSIALAQAVKNRIELNFLSLQALKYFLQASQKVNSYEFENLIKHKLSQTNEIKALSWVDFSHNDIRTSRLIASFEKKDKNTNSQDGQKSLPLAMRKQLLNDLASGENEFLILQEKGILLATTITNEFNRNQQDTGILVADIATERLINEVFKSIHSAGCTISISALSKAGLTEKILFTNTGSQDGRPFYIHPITVKGQTWRISFYHDWGQMQVYQNWPAFWIMIAGMGFTGFLGLTLLYLTGRNFRTEAIIGERTAKLIQTKTSAESANKAKSQFLAKISHELRTPLNGISGFAQLLEKNRSLNHEARHQIAIIKQCAADLLLLINEILDTSAIESEQFKIYKSDFDFNGLFDETIQICKIKADEKGIKLIAQGNCNFKKLHSDEKRIRQILVNLVDNAIKYTSDGSVTVKATYEDNRLKIVVADTGYGISPGDLDRIFLPFVQGDDSDAVQEGVGLGLFIIKELVNLMEGDLSINSQPAMGSVFEVTLPVTASNEGDTNKSISVESCDDTIKQVRVLVVDDSEINLLFLNGLLEHIGCRVDTAKNGFEALALIERNQYDLSLIDINMPLMNGIELVKKIRKMKIKLKIAVVSAYADEEKINEATAAGIDCYLTKPVEESKLIELIKASVHNSSR